MKKSPVAACVAGTAGTEFGDMLLEETKLEKNMSSVIDKINKVICKDHPEYKGVKPNVTERNGELLLVYETCEKTEDGLKLPMQLRVKADAEGRIKAISASR